MKKHLTPCFCTCFRYLCRIITKQTIMATNQINKYVWLVDTIYRAKRISFEEINRRWLDDDISEGLEIPKRTFHKWIAAAEEMFGLVIQCQRVGGYLYYIENAEAVNDNSLQSWLFNTLSVSNTLQEHKSLNDRILLENIPSGRDHLDTILAAMKKGKTLKVTYKSYWRENESTFMMEPYCVKLFRQRWYVVGCSPYNGQLRIYALDRIIEAEIMEEGFDYPKDFSPEAYFEGYFGVIHVDDVAVETVKLKVSAGQANYLRSLPLHASQQEIERNDDFSIFTLQVRPTFDFQQELLWNGDEVEVLEPLWLRKDMAGMVKRMWNLYKDDKK